MDIITNLFKKNLFINQSVQYYNWYTKRLYVINADNYPMFRLYYCRLIICLVSAIILISLNFTNPIYIISLLLVLYVYLTWYFYHTLLKRYTYSERFDINQLREMEAAKNRDLKPNYTKITLFIVFGLLLIINTYLANYELYISLICYGIAIAVILDALRQLFKR